MNDRRDEQPPVGLDAFLSDDLAPAFWTPDLQIEDSRWQPHVPFAFWLAAAARPRRLVELGTGRGVSYAAFCEAAARVGIDAQFCAIDDWGDDRATGFLGDDAFNDFRDFHDRRYSRFSTLKRCAPETASPDFADGSIDLLHIDGARADDAAGDSFAAWRSRLSSRGLLLLHGTRLRDGETRVGRLFAEWRERAPHFEFTHGDGLGLVCAGPEAPEVIAALCRLQAADGDIFRARFEFLGARWSERSIALNLIRQFDDDIQSFRPRDQITRLPIRTRFARSILKTLDDPLRHFRKGRRSAR